MDHAIPNGIDLSNLDLRSISIDLLKAELQRRDETDGTTKPACGSKTNLGTYNVPLHIFAVVIILTLSTIACAFPVIARRFPSLPIPHRFIFLSRHFGTGVLIATAFIHLLPTAFMSMTDPCLPRFWNEIYPPMPGFVAMVAVFAVVSIEQFFALRGAKHSHGDSLEGLRHEGDGYITQKEADGRPNGMIHMGKINHGTSDTSPAQAPVSEHSPFKDEFEEDNDSVDLEDLEALDGMTDESAVLNRPQMHKRHPSTGHASNHENQDPQKMFLQCLLLEAGILFHSIFIGMAVSVATGTQFIVLLVAICFHQTFEGFALGARIANLIPILFDARSPKPWLMCLAYGATTPIGQVIGLLLHNMYDPFSKAGLLTVGITNAVSSGLLLFAGLVQLVAEDFLADESYKSLKGRRRIEANLAVALGGILMAIVGAFA